MRCGGSPLFTAVSSAAPRIARIGARFVVAFSPGPRYSSVTLPRGQGSPDERPVGWGENLVNELIQRALTGLRAASTRQEGQGLTEYGLVLVLIAVVVILMLGVLGGQVSNQYSNIASSVPS
jgi:pilus assembly protein Flp/PilA